MKTQVRITKNFTIRDPHTGRQQKFVLDQIAKGKQIQFATPDRIAKGMFRIEEIQPTEASIARRRDGRANWHVANGTDPQMDMEFIVLDILTRHFGTDVLRQKGSGQTSIFNAASAAYQTEFAEELTYEKVDGSDDPFAFRVDTAWRGIAWANSDDVALRCTAFILDYVLNKY